MNEVEESTLRPGGRWSLPIEFEMGGINIPFPGGFSTHSSSNSQACSKNLGRIIGTGLRGVVFDERASWVPQMRTYPK